MPGLIDEAVKEFGGLDIMVNNAGIVRDALFEKMTESEWREVMETNLTGAFNTASAALPHLTAGSAIINISSVVAEMGNIGQANYAAAKAGLIGFSKSLARELAKKKIRVNVVAPGAILTDMFEKVPEKVREMIVDMTPLRRMGKPEEVADAVLFLLKNEYITGEVLNVNGGLYM